MAIRILVTGGTFDKEYDELTGRLFFKDTHIQEMLRLGRCRVPVTVETLMMIDSLEMTSADRETIVRRCREAPEKWIVITHGTDTMVETAAGPHRRRDREDDRPDRRDGAVGVRQLRRALQPRKRAFPSSSRFRPASTSR